MHLLVLEVFDNLLGHLTSVSLDDLVHWLDIDGYLCHPLWLA